MEFLLANGGDAKQSIKQGMTALHLASEYGHPEVAKLLIEAGADVNATEDDSKLAHCIGRQSMDMREVVTLLLENGAGVDVMDGEGFAPIHWAAEYGHLEVIKILVAKGAEMNEIVSWGETAVDLATRYEHPEVAEFLKEKGGQSAAEIISTGDDMDDDDILGVEFDDDF